jgi:glycosyltransferase involved in cell wall biosynthesis
MLDENLARVFPSKQRKKELYWRFVERRIARDATALVFTCEEERRLAQDTFLPYAAREEIVTLGVEGPPAPQDELVAQFFEKFPQLRGERLLLFLGRLHPKKGCDLLLEAFAHTETPLHLVLAGPCDDATFLSRLQELARGRAVTFAGMLRGRDKWAALAAAEAFILPSHQENFGIAVAEALACGTPVLISDKVNIWREIADDGAGLVESDDTQGAANLLRRWLAADHAAMSSGARRCFERRFHVRVMLSQFTALVEKYAKR